MRDASDGAPGDCTPAGAQARRAVRLTQLRPGEHGVIERSTLAESDAALLSAMGLCCNARVRLCRAGEPCIVAVLSGLTGAGECRIGLARALAERLEVAVDDGRDP